MSFKRLQRALFRTMAAVVALAILFCIGLYGYRTMFGYTYDSSLSDEDLAASVTADENITNNCIVRSGYPRGRQAEPRTA